MLKRNLLLFWIVLCVLIGPNAFGAITKTGGEWNYETYSSAAIVATGTNDSGALSTTRFNLGTVQVVWAGITGTADFEVQSTTDGTKWDTVTGTEKTTSGASGSESFNFSVLPGSSIRVTITSAAGAGTLTAYFLLKR